MNTAWLLPLEPFESRYTGQWYREFPKVFAQKYNVQVIDGTPLSDSIDVGSWLPMNSTVHYKNTQVATMAKMFQEGKVKDDDIVFSFDLEHWGIEAIKMMAQINNKNIRIYAFLHAASYTHEDLMEQLAPWQKYTELGWLSICDKVFVGSEYHKHAVIERRIRPYANKDDWMLLSDKIIVTGNPLFKSEYAGVTSFKRTFDTSGENVIFTSNKINKIIMPNRFDYEKRPNISLDIAAILKSKHPDWEFVITTSNKELKSNQAWLIEKAHLMEKQGIITIKEGLTKKQYHEEIATSKVMLTNSIEENFGYCLAEALYYDTIPVAPRGLSHDEIVPHQCLFDGTDDAIQKIEMVMSGVMRFPKGETVLTRFFDAPQRIVNETIKDTTANEPKNKKGQSKGLLDL
jgi:glycosyltransferase involved in cell wall biosynthesis